MFTMLVGYLPTTTIRRCLSTTGIRRGLCAVAGCGNPTSIGCKPLSAQPLLSELDWKSCASLPTSQSSRHKYTVSYQHGHDSEATAPPLIGKTFGQVVDETTERHPNDEFVVFVESKMRRTFSQYRDEMDRLAAGLVSLGIGRGDRIGIWGPNSLEWVLTMHAAARIGATFVNLNFSYQQSEIEYALKKVGVKAVVASRPFKTQRYYEILADICPELQTSSPGRLQSERLPDLESVIVMGNEQHPGSFAFDDVLDMGGAEEYDVIDRCKKTVQFDDVVGILFTSGTTGTPKAACLTHFQILNNVRAYFDSSQQSTAELDRWCLPVPLYHTSGLFIFTWTLLNGYACVFPPSPFDAKQCLQTLSEEKCSHLPAVPTMFIDMINHPEFATFDVSSIRGLLSGASNVPPEVRRQIESSFNSSALRILYGMSEATGLISTTRMKDPAEIRSTSVGRAGPWIEVKIVDPSTNEIVDVNTRGELCVRGPGVMTEYWNDDEKTKETIDQTRWLHTSDLATMDEDGYLSIVGRTKDMVIRGGVNIFPAAIEHCLHAHPKVKDIQVVGVPDERMIEELCACVKLKADVDCTEDEIRDFCRGKISSYMVPRHVQFVDSFPMTANGKVQKFKLSAEMAKRLNLE